VVLKSGEEIGCNVVSSSVDPHLTFEVFLEPKGSAFGFLESVRRYKYRGSSGKGKSGARRAALNFRALPA